ACSDALRAPFKKVPKSARAGATATTMAIAAHKPMLVGAPFIWLLPIIHAQNAGGIISATHLQDAMPERRVPPTIGKLRHMRRRVGCRRLSSRAEPGDAGVPPSPQTKERTRCPRSKQNGGFRR